MRVHSEFWVISLILHPGLSGCITQLLTEQGARQEDSIMSSPGWISATTGSKGHSGVDGALNLESENQGSNLADGWYDLG